MDKQARIETLVSVVAFAIGVVLVACVVIALP